MSPRAWVDGVVVDAAPDLATGVFETIGVFAGALPLWARHLERLERSIVEVGGAWRAPDGLREAAFTLAWRNGHDVVRVAVAARSEPATTVITTRPREDASEPVLLVEAPHARPRGERDHLKVAARPALGAARAVAQAEGAHDAVLWRDDVALECTAYNLFAVVGERLVTPPVEQGVLVGVARAVLLEGLAEAGTPATVAPLPLADLRASPALFVTNAVHGARRARLGARAPDPGNRWVARLAAAWARGLRLGPR